MVRGFLKLAAVASVCATVAMLGGFASTKSIHKGRGFTASLGGVLYNCNAYSSNATGSTLMYDCLGTNGSQSTQVCMKDSWANGTWSRYYRAATCASNSTAKWIFAKSWAGVI